jgi:hypothetical protein
MATFEEVGFLADDLGNWRELARGTFSRAFTIADRMNAMGMRMMWALPIKDLTEDRMWAVAGYAKAIESFQCCILLAERGALGEARALARVCAETVIVIAGLLKVEGTLEKLLEDEAKHRLGVCNRMIEFFTETGDAELCAKHKQEVAEIKAEYPDPKPLRISALADATDMKKLYEVSFRFPSGNGAHATLGAFRRHIEEGKDGHVDKYVFNPDASDMRQTLLSATIAMMNLIGLTIHWMEMKDYEAEFRDLALHWKVIRADLLGTN